MHYYSRTLPFHKEKSELFADTRTVSEVVCAKYQE